MTTNTLWSRLKKDKRYRDKYIAQYSKQAIPFQVRALMKQFNIKTQAELAERCGLTQGAVSRLLDPEYGNLSMNTMVRVANGLDVAFVGWFVPFHDLTTWFDRLKSGRFYVAPFSEDTEHPAKLEELQDSSFQQATASSTSPRVLWQQAFFPVETTVSADPIGFVRPKQSSHLKLVYSQQYSPDSVKRAS